MLPKGQSKEWKDPEYKDYHVDNIAINKYEAECIALYMEAEERNLIFTYLMTRHWAWAGAIVYLFEKTLVPIDAVEEFLLTAQDLGIVRVGAEHKDGFKYLYIKESTNEINS